MDRAPLTEYVRELRAAESQRPVIYVERIPITVPRGDLALLPFEEQPDSDVNLTCYEQDGNEYYSICVVMSVAGMIDRAQDFFRENPGCSIQVMTFGRCRQEQRGAWLRLPRDSTDDWGEGEFPRGNLPLDLVATAFLTDEDPVAKQETPSINHVLAESQAAQAQTIASRTELPSRAHKRAQTLFREAARLRKLALNSYGHAKAMELSQSDTEIERADPEDSDDDTPAYTDTELARRDAFVKILAVEDAEERAKVALEIACFYDKHGGDEPNEPMIKHSIIFSRDGAAEFCYPPSELPDPMKFAPTRARSSRRWLFPIAPAVDERKECTEHITSTLIRESFGQADFSISYPYFVGKAERYVQIDFVKPADYARAQQLSLDWHTHALELDSSAAPLPTGTTVLMIPNLFDGQDEKVVLKQCIEALEEHLIFETVWRLDEVRAVNGNEVMTKGDSVIAFCSLTERSRAEEVTSMPGYVKTSSGTFSLQLWGRYPVCHVCKGAFTLQYHIKERCAWVECRKCGKGTVHRRGGCPKSRPTPTADQSRRNGFVIDSWSDDMDEY